MTKFYTGRLQHKVQTVDAGILGGWGTQERRGWKLSGRSEKRGWGGDGEGMGSGITPWADGNQGKIGKILQCEKHQDQ